MSYSLHAYGTMILDEARIGAYAGALEAAIQGGELVLELGTGTGVLAFLAKRAGARRVIAVEPSDYVEVAKEIQREEQIEGVEFIRGFSQDIEIDEPADILVSDMRGVLPNLGGHFRVIRDARDRLLKPGGVQLARKDRLYAALACSPKLHYRSVGLWRSDPWGIPMEAAWRRASNIWVPSAVPEEELVSAPGEWCAIDYRTVESDTVAGSTTLVADRACTVHGHAIWFDTEIDDEHGLTNRPGSPKLAYGSTFFPLPEPVEVEAGAEVTLKVDARLVVDDYVWRWTTAFDRPERQFSQSTFEALALSPSILREIEGGRRAQLNPNGVAARAALAVLDGARVDEVARALISEVPQAGFDEVTARSFVHKLLNDFGHFEPA